MSPILSNIMLDDLDRELWDRGHGFVRYADDLRVFVRSERAAQRLFESVCGVIERRLKLKVKRGSPRSGAPPKRRCWGSRSFSPARGSGSGSPRRRSSG